jgi:hypothetical protein
MLIDSKEMQNQSQANDMQGTHTLPTQRNTNISMSINAFQVNDEPEHRVTDDASQIKARI